MTPRTSRKPRCNSYCLTVTVTVKQLNNSLFQNKHADLIVRVLTVKYDIVYNKPTNQID